LRNASRTNDRSMVSRGEGRTLPTMIHVILSKVIHDNLGERIRHTLAVAELPRPSVLGLVLDCLTMKSDDVDCGQVDLLFHTERTYRLRMRIGHITFNTYNVCIVRR